MNDMQERVRERWEQRRKKSNNWVRLIIMVIILVGLLVGINMLNNAASRMSKPQAEFIDSTGVDSTGTVSP